MIHRSAFTLVEAVLSIAVVGLLLAPAVQTISAVSHTRGASIARRQGAALAKELLTEIIQCNHVVPTGMIDGSTRQTWIVISDFNGLTENPPLAHDGSTLAGWTGWKRSVLVEQVDPANPGGSAVGSDLGMDRITVTVTSPTGAVSKLVALRAAQGSTDRRSPAQLTFPSWIDITLDGGGTAKAMSGVNLLNQVP